VDVALRGDRLQFGDRFSVVFQRTLRLPDDGQTYPLPPGLGALPVRAVADLGAWAPSTWRAGAGYVVPLHRREALWLHFEAATWKPNAAQIGVGGIDAVTGGPWSDGLSDAPQNYLVCPPQPWLDGINSGVGTIRQFVAVSLGRGETVEEQLTGQAQVGGLQLRVYEPRPGRFPDQPPEPSYDAFDSMVLAEAPAGAMGVAAGGRMVQKIYPDPYGKEVWDEENVGEVMVHLVSSELYRALTGEEPPPSPITAEIYSRLGYPWFAVDDEDAGTIPSTERLDTVKSLGELDAERQGGSASAPSSVEIDPSQIVTVKTEPTPGGMDP